MQTTSAPKSAASTDGETVAPTSPASRSAASGFVPRYGSRVVEHRAHGVDVTTRLRARTEDRDPLRVRSRERSRGDARNGGVRISVTGDAFSTATSLTCLTVVQQHATHVRVEPTRGVRRHDDDLLQPERRRRAPAIGRHEPEQAVGARRPRDRAKRLVELAPSQRREHLRHRLDTRLHVEESAHVVLGEDEDAHANKPFR